MIEGAFTYPTESDDWVKTIAIGGVLTFFGFLLVPLFIAYGLVIEAIRSTIEGSDQPPEFEDWGTLLVEGLQAWVIAIIYFLVPIIVAVITIGSSALALVGGGDPGPAIGGIFLGLAVTFILVLVFGYFGVVAIVNFAHESEFGAAFDFGTIKTVAFDGDYFVPWLVSIGVFFVAGLVGSIPLIGFIVAPFVSFYASLVAARLWAGGFIDATSEAAEPTEVDATL